MNTVLLSLDETWVQLLLANADEESAAYQALREANDLPCVPRVKHFIRCSEAAAAGILELAKAHCPAAVEAIEKALSRSQPWTPASR